MAKYRISGVPIVNPEEEADRYHHEPRPAFYEDYSTTIDDVMTKDNLITALSERP